MQHYPKSPEAVRPIGQTPKSPEAVRLIGQTYPKLPEATRPIGQTYNLAESSLPALNLATFFALILITAPV